MLRGARPRSASVESAPVSSRDEHGFNRPEIQYGSGSDSDAQPCSSQYSFKDVAKEAAYELLSKDDAPQSKRRESDKFGIENIILRSMKRVI